MFASLGAPVTIDNNPVQYQPFYRVAYILDPQLLNRLACLPCHAGYVVKVLTINHIPRTLPVSS